MIIGIAGKAHSGKTTIANRLLRHSGKTSRIINFADPMKAFCLEVFDFNNEQLSGSLKEVGDPRYKRPNGELLTPRYALQTLGTEWGRNCFTDVWAELGVRRAKTDERAGFLAIIGDVRYLNEAAAIRREGGVIWRVTRPYGGLEAGADHPSEIESDGIQADRVFFNDGTLDDLFRDVDEEIRRLASFTP